MCCPFSVPGLLPSGQHMFSTHEKVSLSVSGEELAATSLRSAVCSFVVAMGSSGWALIQGGLKALLPPLPGLPTPLSVAERAPEDVLLVTGTSSEHSAMIRGPGWLLCCSSGSGAGAWSPSSMAASDWPSTASSSYQVPHLGLMAAEPARLVVCSHLGSGTATLRGPEHHQALPWQGALLGLTVPPRAGAALTCPWGCLECPCCCPGTQECPVSCRLSWTLAQAEPLAPTAAVLARGSPDRCWGDLRVPFGIAAWNFSHMCVQGLGTDPASAVGGGGQKPVTAQPDRSGRGVTRPFPLCKPPPACPKGQIKPCVAALTLCLMRKIQASRALLPSTAAPQGRLEKPGKGEEGQLCS